MKYAVIGGQYGYKYYGGSDTLHGARTMAGKHKELWREPLFVLVTPKIYPVEDTFEIIVNEDSGYHKPGEVIRIPKKDIRLDR